MGLGGLHDLSQHREVPNKLRRLNFKGLIKMVFFVVESKQLLKNKIINIMWGQLMHTFLNTITTISIISIIFHKLQKKKEKKKQEKR